MNSDRAAVLTKYLREEFLALFENILLTFT